MDHQDVTRSIEPALLTLPDDFRAFYEREHSVQVRRAFLLVGSNEQANDVVHDAMIGVLKRWGELDNPGGYLNRSVINGCRDTVRQKSSRRDLVRALRPIEHDEPEFQILDDAIAGLPFNQRATVVLRFYGGWTAEEIALALDCSPNSIGPWLSRALGTLRKDLS
jgi:RNA polymerase sigma factor (sigma-70 family)